MAMVAIAGGGSIARLGTREAVSAFFALVDGAASTSKKEELHLATERLFRRTVPAEQWQELKKQLDACRQVLAEVPMTASSWERLGVRNTEPHVDLSAANAGKAFGGFYEQFDHVLQSVALFLRAYGRCESIRLIAYEGQSQLEHLNLPDEAFERPDITPIWME